MSIVWYEQDREAVVAALGRGERPDMATTMASGPLDELVALHEELGVLEEVEVQRERAGVPDALLLRTRATLPFGEEAALARGGGGVVPRTGDPAAGRLGAGADPRRQ